MKQTGDQVTIERLLPLATLAPGKYTLEVSATDELAKQTISRTADFSIKTPMEQKTAANVSTQGGNRSEARPAPVLRDFSLAFGCVLWARRLLPRRNTRPSSGNLSGEVRDPSGMPQLGATVEVLSEAPAHSSPDNF